ncbi:MAG TPA: metalloprotease PmbA [Acidiferrobacteraceae bacterium]|nr:metalloprotease PmbA [Acidiferrobacteraceae bacterium]
MTLSTSKNGSAVTETYINDALQADLSTLVESALAQAKSRGASSAEAAAHASRGFSVTVRLGDVETIEHNRDKSLGITVFFGDHSGSASTSDFSPQAVRDTVQAACSIARYTAEDPFGGLADKEQMATRILDLDLHHPWDLTVPQAIEVAQSCEQVARDSDKRIINSEGATLSSHEGIEVYANSHGFLAGQRSSRHSLGCAVVGQDDRGMQRDQWYSVARRAQDLDLAETVGAQAAQRTLRRLDARQLSTRKAPVVFEAPIASSVLGHLGAAIQGSNLYRKASFLVDHQGKQLFAPHVQIHENPHICRGLGSSAYDNEGVTTHPRDLVTDGILQGYLLDSYSARKLGLQSTGNAGGVHNMIIKPGEDNLSGLLAAMGTGLLITELIGFGVNILTGDYSRGAAGFWVENGEIQHPVDEITVAGKLQDMFQGIIKVGQDVDIRKNIRTGSLLIDNLTIAGS